MSFDKVIFPIATRYMMEGGVPTTDNEGYQHDQQPIPLTEDGESAANRLRVGIQHEQQFISGQTESTSALTAQSLTPTEDTDDIIGVEETPTTSDTSPVVSLPDSLQSKLTISGTCHKRMPKEPCNFMYKLDL